MTEETNQNIQATEPVAEEVAFHLRPKQKAEDGVEQKEEVNVEEVATETAQETEQPSPQPADNISSEMPQEKDPFEDGTLEQVIEQLSTEPVVEAVVLPEVKEEVIAQPELAPATTPLQSSSDKSEEEVYLDKIRESGTPEQKRILAAVETFAAKMKPRVEIEPIKGSAIQVEFLDHLLWVLKKDYEVFRGAWNVLLVYFNLYHGVNSARSYTALSEFSTTRFMYAWTKGVDKSNCYRNLITLLRATRNKDTRKHDIKTINLAFIGPNVLGEVELNNLKQFYQV